MNFMRTATRTLLLAACLSVAGVGLWTSTGGPPPANAQEKKERHPHIHAAIKELKEARRELKEADHDFGGHRVKAIEAIDHAIEQLEKALKHDKK
jgi:hypothetical protein